MPPCLAVPVTSPWRRAWRRSCARERAHDRGWPGDTTSIRIQASREFRLCPRRRPLLASCSYRQPPRISNSGPHGSGSRCQCTQSSTVHVFRKARTVVAQETVCSLLQCVISLSPKSFNSDKSFGWWSQEAADGDAAFGPADFVCRKFESRSR
jgi:hypothetical protein